MKRSKQISIPLLVFPVQSLPQTIKFLPKNLNFSKNLIFSDNSFLKSVLRTFSFRCTSVYGTPTMFIDLVSNSSFKKYDYSSIRHGIISGAPCPPSLCERLVNELHMKDLAVRFYFLDFICFSGGLWIYGIESS